MRTRELGQSGLTIPVVTFGAWAIGGWHWGGTDDELAVRAIRAGLDCGLRAIDTAPIYGFGHSETVLGRALQGRREEALVLTKVGLRWDDERGERAFAAQGPQGRRVTVRRNLRPDSVRTEVERSLARLKTDVVDLVQVHWPDRTTPLADTLGALSELQREGKLRAIGVSNFSLAELDEAQRLLEGRLASHQPQFSLVARRAEQDVLPWSAEHGVASLVYSPLEQGLLTGKVDASRTFPQDDGRNKRATFAPDNRERVNRALAEAVAPVAEAHDATWAQVVLAWTIQQIGVTSAIVGARRPEQARENAAAGDLVLTPPELARIRTAFESFTLRTPRKDAPLARIRRFASRLLGRG